MKKIWSHHLVRNEERFLWYSVMSVITYVDKVLLWDMDSEDKTPEIISELKKKFPKKILTKYIKKVRPEGFAKVRQDMLDDTKADWFLVVDGDEIWWDQSIQKVTAEIQRAKGEESIVVPMYNAVGDIFHYQEKKAGLYNLAGRRGHYALRAINRRIPGLSSDKPHGKWGWTDLEGKMVQDRDPKKIKFVDSPYIHTTYLRRGGSIEADTGVIKRAKKYKYELGNEFPLDFYYPEAFFKPKPEIVPSPWVPYDRNYYTRALIETPLRKIKRRFFRSKIGY